MVVATMPRNIEDAVFCETEIRMEKQLCLPIKPILGKIDISTGLYYWQVGDEIDHFDWELILSLKSELKMEEALAPLTRYRVKKLIQAVRHLGNGSISFAMYLFIVYKTDISLYTTLDVPYKITRLLKDYIENGTDYS
jgi:hypothetical protein